MKLERVMAIFHDVFAEESVRVAGGYPEPFYRAPVDGAPAEIRFNRDYLNSCLHEVAHWCIAGRERRQQDDYGYWYRPDGRNGAEQREFFRAESGPQAVEWAFALASGEAFRMSLDNLGGEIEGDAEFAEALQGKLAGYLRDGFPPRADRFIKALMAAFHPEVGEVDRLEWLRAGAAGPMAASRGYADHAVRPDRAGMASEAIETYSASSRMDSQ